MSRSFFGHSDKWLIGNAASPELFSRPCEKEQGLVFGQIHSHRGIGLTLLKSWSVNWHARRLEAKTALQSSKTRRISENMNNVTRFDFGYQCYNNLQTSKTSQAPAVSFRSLPCTS